jgi:thiol:disulfide interchange protein
MHTDEDGLLVETFNLHTVPTHFFLDSKGIVKNVFVGFLNAQALVTKL